MPIENLYLQKKDFPADQQHHDYQSWFDSSKATQLINNEEGNQKTDKGDVWKSFYKNFSATYELDHDKRTWLFFSKQRADSDEMTRIKKAAGEITKFFVETELPSEDTKFAQQQKHIKSLYGNLITNCKTYLKEKDWGWKKIYRGEGYRRYQLVERTLTRARSESNKLETRAMSFYEEFKNTNGGERPLWINVLADFRTKQLDLDNRNDGSIRLVGGNCNNVIELQPADGSAKGYVKEDNYNLSVAKKTRQYIDQTMDLSFVKICSEHLDLSIEELKQILEFVDIMFRKNETVKKFIIDGTQCARSFLKSKVQTDLMETIWKSINWDLADGYMDACELLRETKSKAIMKRLIGKFASYFYKCVVTRDCALNTSRIPKNANITNRNIATYRLAELLGIPELIPSATKVKYNHHNRKHHGILMTEAKGITGYNAWKSKDIKFRNNVYMQLNSLQILDALTGQTDRHLNNIIMQTNDKTKMVEKVFGIDNDMCFGNLKFGDFTLSGKSIGAIQPLIIKTRNRLEFVPKLIDRKLYDSVLALDDDLVKYEFADLLTTNELNCFLDRLHGVQDLFQVIPRFNSSIIICNSNELNDGIIKNTLINQRQKSYLTDITNRE